MLRSHSALRTPRSAFRPRHPLFETLEDRSLLATTPVQVLLMIGQSNMGGYPSTIELTPPLDAPQSDVWIWQDDLVQNVGWTSLRGGFGGDSSNFSSGGDGAQFGPEVALGRTLADASPESQFAIIKHVQGGTMQDGWNPDRGGGAGPGQIWIDFVNKTNEALDELSASQLDYEIAGLFVFQGSRDAVNETGVEAANYEQNFTDFISGVRQEFGAPQIPVLFTELPEHRVVGSGASGYGNTLLVRNGQKAVDVAVPLTTMIEANDFSRIVDGTHFDAEGQIGFGQRFAAAHLGLPYEGSARVGSDGFESGTFTSGFEQWANGAWSASGDAIVTTAGAPFDNANHVRLSNSTGDLTRAVDATGLINEKLRFWSKLESFESGDKAFVKVSADGTNWLTVQEFADGQDDSIYRYHEIDLPDIGDTIYVRFDAGMNESTDYWYLDDVIIEGTTPSGSAEFFISDDTATEGGESVFTVQLSTVSSLTTTVNFATAGGTATSGSDFIAASGTLTFAPGETSKTITVRTVNDTAYELTETFTVNLSNPIGGVIIDGQGLGTIIDNDPQPTKFYVVDDASANKTFEYDPTGSAVENYNLNSGNTTPRGAASTIAGDKVWVVDANKKVYVYNTSGSLLGSWTAGSLASNATVQGIATNGTDVWIVDDKGNKVYKYAGAASRLSSSQNAASSFNLNSSNGNPSDLVTDGTSIWVLNNTSTDKVFKYTVSGTFQGSWTISGGGGSPTGITIDPANASSPIWIVDSSTDMVYQFNGGRNATSGSIPATSPFSLSATNTNPQGIADPPNVGRSDPERSGQPNASAISNDSPHDTALLSLLQDLDLLATTKRRR